MNFWISEIPCFSMNFHISAIAYSNMQFDVAVNLDFHDKNTGSVSTKYKFLNRD